MGLPKLETCCFAFDLKTGNIILGCLNAVLSFSMMIVMTVEAVSVGAVHAVLPTNLPNTELELKLVEQHAQETGLYAMCIILILMFLFKFLFDITFVYGVIAERAGIIKAYLIMWVVFFLLSMFIFFLNSPEFTAGTICTELFYIGLNVYAILLSHSFYKELNSREDV